MRPGLVLLALAACGGARRDPDKPKAPVYLALFERGRTWSLPIQIADGHYDKVKQVFVTDTQAHATMVCRVAAVRAVATAKLARLSCDKPYDDLLAAGWWVSTRAGVFHPPNEPADDELASYQQGEPLIAAAPEAHAETDDVEEAAMASQAFVFEGSWCVREASAAELDRRDYTICFDPKGVSGGTELVIIGPDETWHRVQFGKAPRDPDDHTGAP